MPQVRAVDTDNRYIFDLSLDVRRVSFADLKHDEWHQWLIRRCGERWPHIGTHNFTGHATAWANSNEHMFMRCGSATALAVRWTVPLAIRPVIREVFLFMEDKTHPTWRREALRLYRQMQIWAATLGADEVSIGHASDVTLGRLAEMTGAHQE